MSIAPESERTGTYEKVFGLLKKSKEKKRPAPSSSLVDPIANNSDEISITPPPKKQKGNQSDSRNDRNNKNNKKNPKKATTGNNKPNNNNSLTTPNKNNNDNTLNTPNKNNNNNSFNTPNKNNNSNNNYSQPNTFFQFAPPNFFSSEYPPPNNNNNNYHNNNNYNNNHNNNNNYNNHNNYNNNNNNFQDNFSHNYNNYNQNKNYPSEFPPSNYHNYNNNNNNTGSYPPDNNNYPPSYTNNNNNNTRPSSAHSNKSPRRPNNDNNHNNNNNNNGKKNENTTPSKTKSVKKEERAKAHQALQAAERAAKAKKTKEKQDRIEKEKQERQAKSKQKKQEKQQAKSKTKQQSTDEKVKYSKRERKLLRKKEKEIAAIKKIAEVNKKERVEINVLAKTEPQKLPKGVKRILDQGDSIIAEIKDYVKNHDLFYYPVPPERVENKIEQEVCCNYTLIAQPELLHLNTADLNNYRSLLTGPDDWYWSSKKINQKEEDFGDVTPPVPFHKVMCMRRTFLMEKLAKIVITPHQSLQIVLTYETGATILQLSIMYDIPPVLVAMVIENARPNSSNMYRDLLQYKEALTNLSDFTMWKSSFDLMGVRMHLMQRFKLNDDLVSSCDLNKLLLFSRPVAISDPVSNVTRKVNWVYIEDVLGCPGYYAQPLLDRVTELGEEGAVVWVNGWVAGFEIHEKIMNLSVQQL